MELADWTIHYVKARDAMRRSLKEHSCAGDECTFVHQHKTHHFLIAPELREPDRVRDWYTVVCLNTEENLAFLIDHWDAFCAERLSVLFVNPEQNLYWQVNPMVHSLVADPDALEQGLRSMAEQVPLCEPGAR